MIQSDLLLKMNQENEKELVGYINDTITRISMMANNDLAKEDIDRFVDHALKNIEVMIYEFLSNSEVS